MSCHLISSCFIAISSSIVIQFDEAEQHHGEGPEGGAAVTDKRQRDSDDRKQSDGHADVDEEVDGEDARDAVAVIAYKWISLFFREFKYPEDEGAVKSEDHQGTEKSPFFANGAEDEVGALFRHEIEFCLRAVKIPFAKESARANGDF